MVKSVVTKRRRSFWAWGWQDKFPNVFARQRIGQLAAALLGSAKLTEQTPPTLESIAMPASRLDCPAKVSPWVSTDKYQRAAHTYGKSYRDLIRGLHGDFAAAPDVVAMPVDHESVEAILEWASAKRLAVIPYGGGSSVVGGVEADLSNAAHSYNGVISLDMSKFCGVHEFDEYSGLARIGAGTFGPDIESALRVHGHTLRFFPQSFEHSTLGGWIATRAGGHFATGETHIDDLTCAVSALTPRGQWISRSVPASGAGPSPDRMLLGSEGALAVITDAWMKVRPRPLYRLSAQLTFPQWSHGIQALRAIVSGRLHPANARLLDSRETLLHQVKGAVGKNLLLLGFESIDQVATELMDRALVLAKKHGGELLGEVRSRGPDDERSSFSMNPGGAWRTAFVDTPYLFSALVTLGVVADTFETACSYSLYPELHRSVIAAAKAAMRGFGLQGLVSCRITYAYPDGLAPYYTFVTTAKEDQELEVWTAIKEAVSHALVNAGGTITHHHAIGRLHMPWYKKQRPTVFGPALAAMKGELDPAAILNPGVLLDRSSF